MGLRICAARDAKSRGERLLGLRCAGHTRRGDEAFEASPGDAWPYPSVGGHVRRQLVAETLDKNRLSMQLRGKLIRLFVRLPQAPRNKTMAAVDLLMSLKGSSEAGAVEAFKLGPADPNVPSDDQSMSLAKSYGEKYPSAASSVHLEWLVFFEHELMRQAARAENLKERDDASRKFAQLYHVRREAVRLLEAAYVREALHA